MALGLLSQLPGGSRGCWNSDGILGNQKWWGSGVSSHWLQCRQDEIIEDTVKVVSYGLLFWLLGLGTYYRCRCEGGAVL